MPTGRSTAVDTEAATGGASERPDQTVPVSSETARPDDRREAKDVCILFPGLLRCLSQNRAFVERLCRNHAVFFYTSRDYAADLAALDAPFHARYLEDDPAAVRVERHLDAIADGWKIKQFFKLQRCLDLVREHEAETGRRFTMLYKLRTDLWLPPGFDLTVDRHRQDASSLYMETDWYFGGRREITERIMSFYDAIFDRYYGTYDRYWPMDVGRLLDSDFGAGKFERLYFPTEAIGDYGDKASLRRAIADNRERLAAHVPRAGEPLGNLHPNPTFRSMAFAPEPSFLHFVLDCGAVAREMEWFAPLHPGRASRMGQLVPFGARLLAKHGTLPLLGYLSEAGTSGPQWQHRLMRISSALGEGCVVAPEDLEAAEARFAGIAPEAAPAWQEFVDSLARRGCIAGA